MAVPAGPTEKRYTGNGVSTAFTIPFLLIAETDLDVFVDGVEAVSGFVITGAGNPTSTITFTSPPAALSDILLRLNVPFERLNDYQENGDFLASTVNRDFDRIWQALKQLQLQNSRSPVLGINDVDGFGAYRAKGNRISGLSDPLELQDAATKYWAQSEIARAVSLGQGPINVAQNVSYITGDGALSDLQNASIRQFSSVKSIFGKVGLLGGEQAILSSYHAGTYIGGGHLVWAPTVLKSKHDGFRVFSPTVPTASLSPAQASIISYMNRAGETDASGAGCWLRFFDDAVHMEYGGVTEGVDCGLLAQKIIDACVPSGIGVTCTVPLTVGSQLTIPQYRDIPAVQRRFNHSRVSIREIISTITGGITVYCASSCARFSVEKITGPGAAAGITKGVYITGQGANIIDVGFASGFQNDIEFNEAYAQSLIVGWFDDAIRGIVCISSNDVRIKGGRGGGRYSTGQPPIGPTDPTTCEIGIDIAANCAHINIDMNIEYCRRSATSIGINDRGIATQYTGYIESCTGHNINATGKNGKFNILAGGSVLRGDNCGYHAGDTNDIYLTTQTDYYEETPSAAVNTLEFMALQTFTTSGTGKIHGPSGLMSFPRSTRAYRNEIQDNNLLGSATWGAFATGGASAAGIFSASTVAMPDYGITQSTLVTLPALAADNAEYIISQGGIETHPGPLSFGVFGFCASGSVDIYLRVISSDGLVQNRHVGRIAAAGPGGFKRLGSELFTSKEDLNSTFQIRLRTSTGCQLYLCGAYVVNRARIHIPATNVGGVRRPMITGDEVHGTMFPNGAQINGPLCNGYRSTTAAASYGTDQLLYATEVLVGGGYAVNFGPGYDGQVILWKKDASAGTINLIPDGTTIEGSSAAVAFSTPWQALRLQYVTIGAFTGWVKA